jgi:hypothetical protein
MSIFDVPPQRLPDLNDGDFRSLIARLCEAERDRQGGHRTEVSWGGRQTAADGGLDVVVRAAKPFSPTPPLPCPRSGIQVKLGKMEPADIIAEISPKGILRPIIADLAANGGAYLIASAKENLSDSMYERRIKAMTCALGAAKIHTDFKYDFLDQNRIARWASSHPGVAVWLRERLSLPILSGWSPYERWSSTAASDVDDLIVGTGISLRVGSNEPVHDLEKALNTVRELISVSLKAIRIAGLSGIGKTRFVQALFEAGVGNNPLPASQAIYCDAGLYADPTPQRMLDILIELDQPMVVVVDNCPPDLHRDLAERLSKTVNQVKVITVEYDLRDDRPNETEVVRMEAEGEEIVEKLLQRRHSEMGRDDVHRIARLSDGNARLAIAIANAVPETGSLSSLGDFALFERLFWQRGAHNDELSRAAGALSLVYSFDIEGKEAPEELNFLGEIVELSRLAMHRYATALVTSGLAQARGHWRAVLPHALANRLAGEALCSIPVDVLADHFAAPNAQRLRKSLARRLGYMHNLDQAKRVVRRWMEPGGPLDATLVRPDSDVLDILDRAGHLVPSETLKLVSAFSGQLLDDRYASTQLPRLISVAQATAFELEHFEPACDVLLELILKGEDIKARINSEHLTAMFYLYRSGTLAETDRKREFVRKCIKSEDSRIRRLGLEMLRNALKWTALSGGVLSYDSARPNADGWHPKGKAVLEWFRAFLDLATEFGSASASDVRNDVRQAVARSLHGLWRLQDLRDDLIAVSHTLQAAAPWPEGYHAFRKILYVDIRRNGETDAVDRDRISAEIETLKPEGLADEIRAIISARWNWDVEVSDDTGEASRSAEQKRVETLERLGKALAEDSVTLGKVSSEIFCADGPSLAPLGAGMARGVNDIRAHWDHLLSAFLSVSQKGLRADVLSGFLAELDRLDPELGDNIRDEILVNPSLVPLYRSFVREANLDESGFERLLTALENKASNARQFDDFLWRENHQMSDKMRVIFLDALLAKPLGEQAVLNGLTMLLHVEMKRPRAWPQSICDRGIMAVCKLIETASEHVSDEADHEAAAVVSASLPGASTEMTEALFAALRRHAKKHYGRIYDFDQTGAAMAKAKPLDFLSFAESIIQDTGSNAHRFFETGFQDTSLLADVPTHDLREWCSQGATDRWTMVASGVSPWTKNDGKEALNLQALELLAVAPSKVAIIQAFCSSIELKVTSGDRAVIVEGRLNAVRVLLGSPDSEMGRAAAPFIEAIEKKLTRIQEQEQRGQEERQQSFGD